MEAERGSMICGRSQKFKYEHNSFAASFVNFYGFPGLSTVKACSACST